jgi:hypothetical protein
VVNRAKNQSEVDGKRFLRAALTIEQEALAVRLKLSSESITHDGVMGEVNEQHFIDVLRKYLPMRYAIAHGIVIDSNGATSDQIDIVIFDRQYTPTLLDQQDHRFIPAEAVYGVLEVKPTINKGYLEYAADKAKSVRDLERTSIPIVHAGGEYPPKPLFSIIAGIVAPQVEWAEGLVAEAFWANHQALTAERRLDCCLALSDRSADVYEGKAVLSEKECGLAFFLFRLLQKLQSLGTVPAVDWNRYAQVLGTKNA